MISSRWRQGLAAFVAVDVVLLVGLLYLSSSDKYEQFIFMPFGPELVWNSTDAYLVMPLDIVKRGPALRDIYRPIVLDPAAEQLWESNSECRLSVTLVVHLRRNQIPVVQIAPATVYGIQELDGVMYLSGPCEDKGVRLLCWKLEDDRLSMIGQKVAERLKDENGSRFANRTKMGYRWDTIRITNDEIDEGLSFELEGHPHKITWKSVNNSVIFFVETSVDKKQIVAVPYSRWTKGGRSLAEWLPTLEKFASTPAGAQ